MAAINCIQMGATWDDIYLNLHEINQSDFGNVVIDPYSYIAHENYQNLGSYLKISFSYSPTQSLDSYLTLGIAFLDQLIRSLPGGRGQTSKLQTLRQHCNQRMGWVAETVESIKFFKIRKALNEAISLGLIISSALIIWKALMIFTGSESPVVVVLSGSMEPGFKRGDILFLHMSKDPIRSGEIVVFNVDGRPVPIVHRVIKVHERKDTGEVYILTKGDANRDDDRGLYAPRQRWLEQRHIMGRAVGFLPYVGWVTIIMTEKPIVKYVLIGALGLLVITSKD